jgi:hypothetical protein
MHALAQRIAHHQNGNELMREAHDGSRFEAEPRVAHGKRQL